MHIQHPGYERFLVELKDDVFFNSKINKFSLYFLLEKVKLLHSRELKSVFLFYIYFFQQK